MRSPPAVPHAFAYPLGFLRRWDAGDPVGGGYRKDLGADPHGLPIDGECRNHDGVEPFGYDG